MTAPRPTLGAFFGLGASLPLKLDACRVKSQDAESLKRDERLFDSVVLAGLHELRAKDDPRLQGVPWEQSNVG